MEVVLLSDMGQHPPQHEGVPILHRIFTGLGQAPVQEPVHHVCTGEHRLIQSQIVSEKGMEKMATSDNYLWGEHERIPLGREMHGLYVHLSIHTITIHKY